MSIRKHLLSAAAIATLAAACPTGASAGENTPSSESIKRIELGLPHDKFGMALSAQYTIEVQPDNLDWTNVVPTKLRVPFHALVEPSKLKWAIKNAFIMLGVAPIESAGVIGACCGTLTSVPATTYPHALYPDSGGMNEDVWWEADVGNNSYATRARNACRNLRQDLEHQGLSHDEIFGEDRVTTMSEEFRLVAQVRYQKIVPAKFDPSGYGLPGQPGVADTYWMQSQSVWIDVQVLCKKRDGLVINVNPDIQPGADDLSMGFQVNQAALAISPKPYQGKCPAKIHLNPTIEATGKGTVKYRFVDQLGNHSQTFQVKFDKHDVKFLDHVIEIDAKGKPKGLGFAVAQPQGGDFGLTAPNDPNLVQGYFKMEVLSPHPKESNLADYSVKCTVKTGSDDLVAPPDTVNPVVVDGDLAAGLPDLFVEDVLVNPLLPYRVVVKITNQGQAASKPTNIKAIRWTGNLNTVKGTLVPAIQAGQSQVIQVMLSGTYDGATGLDLSLDDPNRIPEKDEGNNTYKVK